MRAQLPEIPNPAPSRTIRRKLIFLGIPWLLKSETIKQTISLCDGKTSNPDIKSGIDRKELLELLAEDLLVPACIQCQLVVSERVGPLLGGRELIDVHTWDVLQRKQSCCGKPAMAGKHHVVAVEENG